MTVDFNASWVIVKWQSPPPYIRHARINFYQLWSTHLTIGRESYRYQMKYWITTLWRVIFAAGDFAKEVSIVMHNNDNFENGDELRLKFWWWILISDQTYHFECFSRRKWGYWWEEYHLIIWSEKNARLIESVPVKILRSGILKIARTHQMLSMMAYNLQPDPLGI